MEKSLGIEAARAKLGDIADHARTTGQAVALTRHGRTVAVIGPAAAVRPVEGVEVTLYFPHREWVGRLPAVPRQGETVRRETQTGEETWVVSEVEWYLHLESEPTVSVTLDPVE